MSEEEIEKRMNKVDDKAHDIFKDLAVDPKELRRQKEDAEIVGKLTGGWGDDDIEIKL
jgi:putative ubiquitin-RnfH superfamily antitoxin RatB of RatAB toxin-antitoxin module